MSALRELLAVFSIDVEDEKLHKAEKGIDGFEEKIKELGEAFAEGFGLAKAKEFFAAQVEGAAHVEDLAERLGLSAEALRNFGITAKEAGMDLETSAHTLDIFNRNVGQAVTMGGDVAQAFAQLHVNLKGANGQVRPAAVLMGDLAEAITKLPSPQERASYAMRVFGREGQTLLPILIRGRAGFEEMSAASTEFGGELGDDFFLATKKARTELEKWGIGLETLRLRITAAALPAIMAVAQWLQKIIKPILELAHQTNALQHIMEMLAGVAGIKVIQTLLKLAKTFGILKPSIGETVMALMEFALPVLLIAALGLAVEDLWTAIEGGDSVIGDFLTNLYGVDKAKTILDDLRNSFADLQPVWEQLKALGPLVLQGVIESIPIAARAFLGLTYTVKAFFDSFVGVAKGLKELGLAFTSDNLDDISKHWMAVNDRLSEAGNKTLKDIDVAGDTLVDRNSAFGKLIHGGSTNTADYGVPLTTGAPINVPMPGAPAAAGATVQQQNQINVTVQGGKDPKATGEAVGAGAATELQKVNANALAAVEAR